MPGLLLSVDPGIRGCGVALFSGGKLERAAYVKNPAKEGNTAAAAVAMARVVVRWPAAPLSCVALEWPRVYASRIREGTSKADPNDLLALCAVDGAIVAMLGDGTLVDCFAPSDWKGQLKKAPCQRRIETRLSEDELEVLEGVAPASLVHNVFDAVGIGLYRLGRFDRVRVIP